MKYAVIIEQPAEDDIEQAFHWIEKGSRSRAETWFQSLHDAIKSLETYPEWCPFAPENEALLRFF